MFARKGRWFAATMDGEKVAGETVGKELQTCFDAISGKL
jgi:hypothetical protein